MRIFAVLSLILAASGVSAQSVGVDRRPKCSDGDSGSGGGKTKYEVVTGADGKKIFRIKTGFVICGKVPKPDVLYGLLNTTINYEWDSLKQDFLPKVIHSVDQSPF